MKLIHLSDLHLGKRVNEYSMLGDQAYILNEILGIIDEETPEGVIIAGDVYDRAVPPAEAVQLFDDFLAELAKRKLQVFVISGNHDSPERIAFGGRLMGASGIHMSPVYNGRVEPVSLEDAYGPVNIYMLPFVKPVQVRRFCEKEDQAEAIVSYTEAMRTAISNMKIDPGQRNVLVTHQFVTGALRSESEEVSVGGSDNVDASTFSVFDYTALGHIHSPQNCSSTAKSGAVPEAKPAGRIEADRRSSGLVRYCGTPLKYSFSEAKDEKSVTVVELLEKGQLAVYTRKLAPKRDLVELKGTYQELTLKSFYKGTSWQEDYVHITLTDEEDIPDAIGKLRTVYHHLMKLDYDNRRTRAGVEIEGAQEVETKSPLLLFADFYELQNNQPLSREQEAWMKTLIEKIWEEDI